LDLRQAISILHLPLKRPTFKREAADKWPVSLVVEFDLPHLPKPAIEPETAIGIDVGDRFAADSDDSGPESKIKRARRKKGSATQAKARRALAREYEKIANNRADFAHKFSTSVVKENTTIAFETLNLKGTSKTKIAKSVHVLAMGVSNFSPGAWVSDARKDRYLFPVCLCDSERELSAFDSSDIDFHRVGRFSIRRQNDVHYFPRPARSCACLAALTDPPKVTTIRKEPKNSRNKRIFSRFASLYYVRARNPMLPDRSSMSD
jgi:hypothetical protein